MDKLVDLAALTRDGEVRNLAGRERGRAARAEFGLDELDRSDGEVVLQLPANLLSMADSFLQEMFAPSIALLGGLDNFSRKYRFVGNPSTLRHLHRGLQRAAEPRTSIFATG